MNRVQAIGTGALAIGVVGAIALGAATRPEPVAQPFTDTQPAASSPEVPAPPAALVAEPDREKRLLCIEAKRRVMAAEMDCQMKETDACERLDRRIAERARDCGK